LFAGQLLKAHGIQFDVVYTSWLSRAIETAWMVVNELEDSLWVPIVKTWRLNERMYGALTGLSKKMIRQRHGVTKFLEWRRSFDIPPPAISSFSHAYPGNDERYMNYVQDLPISIFESLIRSLAHGKPEIHRQFPKAESLKMCMERTIPYFKDVIVPQSINKGKSVLIASSENAIRGLLMHLCDIPIDRIHQVEIPTGLPLVYDSVTRRIRLLEDGLEGSPVDRYDFGASPELLLKPSVATTGVFGKKNKDQKCKSVLCDDEFIGKDEKDDEGNEKMVIHNDDEDDDEDEVLYYNPVILIHDKNLLKSLNHPKKSVNQLSGAVEYKH
jgi:2,3-bisphosphoglycerate-dependent phosphoglycerate mutase